MKYLFYDTALNGMYTLHFLQQAYPENSSLFKKTKDENLFDVAPFLFRIDDNFFENTDGPILSLKAIVAFESEERINDLLDHFQSYMYIVIKGQENYFRFWDGRVLSRFLPACSSKELLSFFDGIIAFYVLDMEQQTSRKYLVSRGKLNAEELPLFKLFKMANAKETEMQTADAREGVHQSKAKRKFF